MDIAKVHYDPAAAITVKAKKKIPAGTFVVPADDVVVRFWTLMFRLGFCSK